MANFEKNGNNVHGQILKAPWARDYQIGLWGPIDIRDGTELRVFTSQYNYAVKTTPGGMIPGRQVRVWNISGLPVGPTLIVAADQGDVVWTQVTIDTTPGDSTPGQKYTQSPFEAGTMRTTPLAPQVVTALKAAWPELTEVGARTMTAQFMAETGNGRNCYNWNLGNVKGGAGEPHMYLHGVWECASQSAADAHVRNGGGNARLATPEEITAKGWKCPNVVVVFDPPHPASRFRAFSSLQVGAAGWIEYHRQHVMVNNPQYLTDLNAGNVAAVAHALRVAGYYTLAEAEYARQMSQKKEELDAQLGAPPLQMIDPILTERTLPPLPPRADYPFN